MSNRKEGKVSYFVLNVTSELSFSKWAQLHYCIENRLKNNISKDEYCSLMQTLSNILLKLLEIADFPLLMSHNIHIARVSSSRWFINNSFVMSVSRPILRLTGNDTVM